MTSNSKDIIEKMQSSFPHIYNVYNKNTVLYALLQVYGQKYGIRNDIIDRLYAMIGIDSTYDEDLEHRWGKFLGIKRNIGESYDEYRNRLLIVYSSLSGGTAEAIKYAIASVIGITSKPDEIDKYIKVYDAWEYPYDIDSSVITDISYGNAICTVNMFANENVELMHNKVANAVNTTKASGVNVYLIFLYTAEENISLSYTEQYTDTIVTIEEGYSDDISVGTGDSFTDRQDDTINDNITLTTANSNILSTEGTNSYSTTNDTFITNSTIESDELFDKIV